jgi:Fe2+ or Zn2+ uptake regulation protein
MINFIEGKINLGEKNISVVSNYENLIALAEEGLIEKREDAGGMYYYF